jgi:hypothetical protein
MVKNTSILAMSLCANKLACLGFLIAEVHTPLSADFKLGPTLMHLTHPDGHFSPPPTPPPSVLELVLWITGDGVGVGDGVGDGLGVDVGVAVGSGSGVALAVLEGLLVPLALLAETRNW